MSRHDLTDEEWSAIRVFLPAERPRRRGRPWKPHRQVVNGMLWVISLGGAWPDVPEEFGKWKTIYNRFRRWQREGLWDRIMKGLLHRLDREGKIDRRLWCVDGTLIRAHRAAGGADTTAEEISKNQALGRSQGGFGTKLHLLTDGEGTPLAVTRTPGQSHESKEFENILSSVPVTWQQQPNRRPIAIAGDKGYTAHCMSVNTKFSRIDLGLLRQVGQPSPRADRQQVPIVVAGRLERITVFHSRLQIEVAGYIPRSRVNGSPIRIGIARSGIFHLARPPN